MLQNIDDLGAHPIVDIEIRPHDADRERGRLSGERLADALGEHRIDLHQLVRVVVEDIADRRVDLGRAMARARIDLHLEFALVGGIRILAVLRAPDLLGDTLDAGDCHEPFGYLLAHAGSLRERYARAQRCVGDQIVFAKIRQQACARAAADTRCRRGPWQRAGRRSSGAARAATRWRAIGGACTGRGSAPPAWADAAPSSSTLMAGVALMATSSDRPTASRNAIDNGRKNAPCRPDIMRIGRKATATAAVA